MPNELTKYEKNLPTTVNELQKFILISKEKLKVVSAQVNGIKRLELSKSVYDQKLTEAQDLGGIVLMAEAKMGEFLRKEIKHGGQNKRGSTNGTSLKDIGVDKKESHRAQKLADNQDIIEQVIAENKESDNIPTRKEVFQIIKKKKNKKEIPESEWLKLYNIWNFHAKNNSFGQEHFGNQTAELILNLLYGYTEPDSLTWDVFAGGGLVHDVCKYYKRQCYSTDIEPIKKRKNIINKWNAIEDVLPDIDPNFIFMDPPYWKQAENKYSNSPDDFANMPIERFYSEFDNLFKKIKEKYNNFTIAFLIQNTQWKNDKKVEPHGLKIAVMMDKYFKFEHHIIVPYSTQQCMPQMVNYAKEHKLFLQIHRDLLIFKG